ncbi:MAG TPA: UDP-N-acetylmuramoyl-tripeptide--D-alanyl-D-alanine ligase [Candidatus Paceibacterota bacterium]|nr:UDP-N-acetylmuramoyl-tripeptide--D-alanyl-D-alanine ligase [Candidatus Paceibacterota bacterium]
MKSILKNIVVSIMTLEARVALMRHRPKVIAVTGNVGKTSAKDAIYAVMAHVYGEESVRKSEKSFNSEIGLPLAILGLENGWSSAALWLKNIKDGLLVALFGSRRGFPEWLVLEVGADHPGDIERAAKWLHSDIVVLTRMSDVPVHVEFFKDADELLREKMFLAHALKPAGTIVVNADDPRFMEAVKMIPAKTISYGTAKTADVVMAESEISYMSEPVSLPIGQYVVVRMGEEGKAVEKKIELRFAVGDHIMYAFAAATAVAKALGIENAIPDAFKDFKSPNGRMRMLKGINGCAVIDDSYNSSPLACAEALKTLAKMTVRGKKIAVLGDMKELGANAERAHRDVGFLAAETLHTLVTVGESSRSIASAARDAGLAADRILSFDDSVAAAPAVADIARAGDVILVKGSQSMRMERVSKALLAHPERAPELLVRQEKEWVDR